MAQDLFRNTGRVWTVMYPVHANLVVSDSDLGIHQGLEVGWILPVRQGRSFLAPNSQEIRALQPELKATLMCNDGSREHRPQSRLRCRDVTIRCNV